MRLQRHTDGCQSRPLAFHVRLWYICSIFEWRATRKGKTCDESTDSYGACAHRRQCNVVTSTARTHAAIFNAKAVKMAATWRSCAACAYRASPRVRPQGRRPHVATPDGTSAHQCLSARMRRPAADGKRSGWPGDEVTWPSRRTGYRPSIFGHGDASQMARVRWLERATIYLQRLPVSQSGARMGDRTHLHLTNPQYCFGTFHGKSFPWVKAVTHLGRGAMRYQRRSLGCNATPRCMQRPVGPGRPFGG
jgi:hypothetical protein